jgi:hypothetical protein
MSRSTRPSRTSSGCVSGRSTSCADARRFGNRVFCFRRLGFISVQPALEALVCLPGIVQQGSTLDHLTEMSGKLKRRVKILEDGLNASAVCLE